MKTNRFSESFANADAAFSSMYATELKQLKGLSKEEINAIVPASNSAHVYQALVEVVEKASKDNLAQAQLISKIKSLETSAINIAKKIPSLAMLL
jgi:tRNA U54 and U55 pseudouridine synthase Pus10